MPCQLLFSAVKLSIPSFQLYWLTNSIQSSNILLFHSMFDSFNYFIIHFNSINYSILFNVRFMSIQKQINSFPSSIQLYSSQFPLLRNPFIHSFNFLSPNNKRTALVFWSIHCVYYFMISFCFSLLILIMSFLCVFVLVIN